MSIHKKTTRSTLTGSNLMDAIPDLLFVLSREGVCLEFKADLENCLNLDPTRLVGRNIHDFGFSDPICEQITQAIRKALASQEPQAFEVAYAVGKTTFFDVRIIALEGDEVLAIARNITERKLVEQQLEHKALHDSLTNLPNRSLFLDRLNHAIQRTRRRPDSKAAVLFLDLDRFKQINDSLGHTVGDQLLVAVARRLSALLRPGDTVSRFGGDEFAILLEDVQQIGDATRVAERIQADLARPFQIGGQRVFTRASLGIALTHAGCQRAEDLVHAADLAMYRAKSKGNAQREVFDPFISTHTSEIQPCLAPQPLYAAIE